MKVVIVGASYTGIQLARTLADEKSDVVLLFSPLSHPNYGPFGCKMIES